MSPLPDRRLRVLLTGFEPFGGEPVNPSQRVATALAAAPRFPAGLELVAEVLPVDRARFRGALEAALERHRPDVVVCLGQATGRGDVDLELRAHNRIDYRGERDNGGHAAADEPLEPGGPASLGSTLPLAELAGRLQREQLPVALSEDAGRHLCNAVLYELLRRHPAVPAAFVHLPLLPEQAARRGRGEPSLPEEVSRACVAALLHQLPGLLRAGA